MRNPGFQNPTQVPLSERDQEIQTLATDATHQPFTSCICYWRAHWGSQDPYTESCYRLVQSPGKDAVMIVDHETIRVIPRQRFPELLQGPLSRRMFGDTVVKDLPATEFHDYEYIEDTESSRDHREEIAGDDRLGVIANEG